MVFCARPHFTLTLTALACTGLLALAVTPAAAQTQRAKPVCSITYETILPLREPVFDTLQLWHSFTGGEGRDRFAALIPDPAGGWLAAGDTLARPDPKGVLASPPEAYIVSLDNRGRPQQEFRTPIKGLTGIKTAARFAAHIALAADTARDGRNEIVIVLKKEPLVPAQEKADAPVSSAKKDAAKPAAAPDITRIIADDGFDLTAEDMAVTADGKTLYVLAHARSRANQESQHARLYALSPDGAIRFKRDYPVSPANVLKRLRALPNRTLVAAGGIDDGRGRMQGWTVAFGSDGGILWQNTYPRGAAAILRDIAPAPHDQFVVTGDSMPSDGGTQAGWVMGIKAGGDPVWQRFYTGSHIFSGAAVASDVYGRTMAVLNGRPSETLDARTARSHVRILTLSPYAELVGDEAVTHGAGAIARQFATDDAVRRYLTGHAQTSVAARPDTTYVESLQDGWVLALPALSPYKDPCKPKPLFR